MRVGGHPLLLSTRLRPAMHPAVPWDCGDILGPVTAMPGAHDGPAAGRPAGPAVANAAQAAEWDGPAGAHRTRHAAVFDGETRPHNQRFRAATGVASREHVLDF